MPEGQKHGGRKKGTPNKKTQEIQEQLDAMGCNPLAISVGYAMDYLPCVRCGPIAAERGVKPLHDDEGRCFNCKDTGFKIIDDKQQVAALTALMKKVMPDLASKTVEKTTKRIVLARMNHLNQEDQVQLRDVIDDAEESGDLDE